MRDTLNRTDRKALAKSFKDRGRQRTADLIGINPQTANRVLEYLGSASPETLRKIRLYLKAQKHEDN